MALKLLQLFKLGFSLMHINYAEDLINLSVLKFCCFIGMLSTLFSLFGVTLVDMYNHSFLAFSELSNFYHDVGVVISSTL